MNEIYWMTVVGNLSTAFMVVWIVALLVIVTMLFALLVTAVSYTHLTLPTIA